MEQSVFPSNFVWGAATSAYQIEGATNEDGRGDSIWDYFAALPGKTFRGQTGAVAIDHYHRFEDDVALMASLGLGAYRFSIAWPRIIPDGAGPVNPRGLDFYDRLVDTLLRHHITPMVTLYHWDLPLPLHTRGGWLRRDTAQIFADYAEVVAKRLGDRVPWWITQNEPWCAAFLGYGNGIHAPGFVDPAAAVTAGHHLLLSHGLALPRIRSHMRTSAQVGIALNLYPVYPGDDSPETQRVVSMADNFKNRWFLDPVFRGEYPETFFEELRVPPPPIMSGDMDIISQPIDFLGVNYYSRYLTRATAEKAEGYEEITDIPGSQFTALNWEVFPEGLTAVLQRVHEDYGPARIFITENGAAYYDKPDNAGQVVDQERLDYLQQHIAAIGEAISQGVPVQGYLAWSLLDNYEWAEGYHQRFGLVYVDFATQQRTIKASGQWYSDFISRQRTT